MTKEQARELLIGLSPMMPYSLKIDREWVAPMSGSPEHSIDIFSTFDMDILESWIDEEHGGCTICDDGKIHFVRKYSCKPYLRPMSSMTEEEKKYLYKTYKFFYSDNHITSETVSIEKKIEPTIVDEIHCCCIIDWLNAHHFDYRGWIDKGLALEAPEGMYNY